MRAELADLIDQQMEPLGRAAMDALAPRPGFRVVDIGCGAGATLLDLADRVAPDGRVTGIDPAPAVLAVARHRTRHRPEISLKKADAATVALGANGYDALFSRFGTMVFPDPTAAFAHLRACLRPSGSLGFVCWRTVGENELDHLPLRAAGLADGPKPPHAALADRDATWRILRGAGFGEIEITPFDALVSCGGVEATLRVVMRVGALGRVLRDHPALAPDAEGRVRAALENRAANGQVALRAATWVVTARSS